MSPVAVPFMLAPPVPWFVVSLASKVYDAIGCTFWLIFNVPPATTTLFKPVETAAPVAGEIVVAPEPVKVMAPLAALAAIVAVGDTGVPPPPVRVTAGADVYPLPALVTVT